MTSWGVARGVVVGGGIVGTLHAWALRRAGWEVVHLEASHQPLGASVRNFGLIWSSGRRSGEELAAALRSRQLWEELAAEIPGIGFRPCGSLTVATNEAERTVMEAYAGGPEAAMRQTQLLEPPAVRALNPALRGQIAGALWCPLDAVVEPSKVLGAVRAHLQAQGGYRFLAHRAVTALSAGSVRELSGDRHQGDVVVVAPGAWAGSLDPLVEQGSLRRVRLQMLQTAPLATKCTTALGDADTLRYYPAYESSPLELLGQPLDLARRYGLQLLCVQRPDGRLTVGDSHDSEEPFDFSLTEDLYHHLLGRLATILGVNPPPVERRWDGVYSQRVDGGLCHRAEVSPGVWVVTALGGRGMTCAPAVAEATLAQAGIA